MTPPEDSAVLDERYGATYCALDHDVEAAARWPTGNASLTTIMARVQLQTLVGGDEPFLNPLLAL